MRDGNSTDSTQTRALSVDFQMNETTKRAARGRENEKRGGVCGSLSLPPSVWKKKREGARARSECVYGAVESEGEEGNYLPLSLYHREAKMGQKGR